MALTRKRALFAKEFILDRNASQAAVRAGYTPHRANQAGYQLVTNNDVQEEISRLMSQKNSQLDWSREAILAGLARESQLQAEDGGSSTSRIQAFAQLGKLTMGELNRNEMTGGLTVEWLDNAESSDDKDDDQG